MPLFLKIFLPILALILFAPFSKEVDLFISQQFFINGAFSKNQILRFYYDWGIYPAWIVSFICFILLIKKKKIALSYLFTFVVGGGLIAQAIFKQFWPRPRPVQIDIFGGFTSYQPFWIPATKLSEPMKSMPCGHCTAGFVFFALIFMGFQLKNKSLTYLGFFLVLFLGGGLSLARIAQGGHFFSDVLIGMIIMWISAVLGDAFFKLKDYETLKSSS